MEKEHRNGMKGMGHILLLTSSSRAAREGWTQAGRRDVSSNCKLSRGDFLIDRSRMEALDLWRSPASLFPLDGQETGLPPSRE